MFNTWIIVLVYGRFFFYIFFYTICFPFFSCLFFLVSSTIVTLLYWKYMYCYFKNSHLLQYIALILNMLIKQSNWWTILYCTLTEICMCSATDSRHQWFNYVRQCILFNDLNESWSFVRMHADLASALFGLKVGVCIRAHLYAHVEMFTRCQMSQLLQVVFFLKISMIEYEYSLYSVFIEQILQLIIHGVIQTWDYF